MRSLKYIIFILMVFSAHAGAYSQGLQPCRDEKDQGPCTVTQSAPFKNIQVKAGMNVHAVDGQLVVSWLGAAEKVTLTTLEIYDPMPLVAEDLRQIVIRYAKAAQFNSPVVVNVTRRDGHTVQEQGNLLGPSAIRVQNIPETPGKVVNFGNALPIAQVWLPPAYRAGHRYPIVYVADGGDNRGALVAAAISKVELEPVIVVGVDACAASETDHLCRLQHYIEVTSGPDLARFLAYEKFFIHTLVPKVETTYGRPVDATQRAITGYSAGGSWAASMALRHPKLFGRSIAMSPSWSWLYPMPVKTHAVFAMSGGELEPSFSIHAQCFAGAVTEAGGTATLRFYPAGHSEPMWTQEFMAAMKDWIGVPRPKIMNAPSRPAFCPRSIDPTNIQAARPADLFHFSAEIYSSTGNLPPKLNVIANCNDKRPRIDGRVEGAMYHIDIPRGVNCTVFAGAEDWESAPLPIFDAATAVSLPILVYPDKVPEPALARELIEMGEQDQALRRNWKTPDSDFAKRGPVEDERRQHRLEEIVTAKGWPTISMVGFEAANAAWLIAQHSPPERLERLKYWVAQMQIAAVKHEIFLLNLATSIDRVRAYENKQQLYGTQYRIGPDGVGEPTTPIEDIDNLDKRRLSMGLSTYAEHLAMLKRSAK